MCIRDRVYPAPSPTAPRVNIDAIAQLLEVVAEFLVAVILISPGLVAHVVDLAGTLHYRGILVRLVMHQVQQEKNQIQCYNCFQCIFDIGLSFCQ